MAQYHQLVIVLDFGGQYNQLIARRVRDCHIYCEVLPCTTPIDSIKSKNPIGIIFTGGPNSVFAPHSPTVDESIFSLGIPILGICYGCQLMAYQLGGVVKTSDTREYGKTVTYYDTEKSPLFAGFPNQSISWMSHTDFVEKVPEGFEIVATTDNCPTAAYQNKDRKLFAFQFHPEVQHTENGIAFIKNFLTNVCGAQCDWNMTNFAKTQIEFLQNKIGSGKVLLALSGGVDSSVVAALLSRAVGNQLTCIFVDTGMMRLHEGDEVEAAFKDRNVNFIRVNAEEQFLSKLTGVTEPEYKRKIIGEEFIRVFEVEAKKIGHVDYFAQGTIYPDIIESGAGNAATIKSHHNVGGLPDHVDFKEIIEPLRLLFKDEIRRLGTELGLPDYLVNRQPFPGPGLGIRIIGEVTRDKLDILREADFIFREEIAKVGLDKKINQYFAVLTNTKSVGVMGDSRTYDYTVALRGVTTTDFMTADWAQIPYEVLGIISNRIVNEVRGVNRIVYDITSKPPSTIEWE